MTFSADLKSRLLTALAEPAAATELEAAVSAATGEISDTAYNATSWNDVTAIGASKNALRDKFVLVDAADALKAPLASPTFTGTIGTPLTVSRALATDGSGNLAASGTSATELGYVTGVTSAIQTQMNTKLTATQAANVTALAGTLTGTTTGTMVNIVATAGSCAGGATPANTDVDTAIATAVASIVLGTNLALKELQEKVNAEIAALKLTNIQASA